MQPAVKLLLRITAKDREISPAQADKHVITQLFNSKQLNSCLVIPVVSKLTVSALTQGHQYRKSSPVPLLLPVPLPSSPSLHAQAST